MRDWGFAQTDPSQQLAQVHYFSILKQHSGGEVEFLITVKEYLTPREPTMSFFAQADKEINQKTAPYRPVGWGRTLLEVFWDALAGSRDFPTKGRVWPGACHG